MTFWSNIADSALEPKRNYRFRLKDGENTTWWWAKSVDKPSFDVSSNEYQLINHKFSFPGIVTWKPISIVVADIGDVSNVLMNELEDFGYNNPSSGTAMSGLKKAIKDSSIANNMIIEQLDGGGSSLETWKLKGAFIKSVNFAKLDYSSDEISEITIEIAYDFATFE